MLKLDVGIQTTFLLKTNKDHNSFIFYGPGLSFALSFLEIPVFQIMTLFPSYAKHFACPDYVSTISSLDLLAITLRFRSGGHAVPWNRWLGTLVSLGFLD